MRAKRSAAGRNGAAGPGGRGRGGGTEGRRNGTGLRSGMLRRWGGGARVARPGAAGRVPEEGRRKGSAEGWDGVAGTSALGAGVTEEDRQRDGTGVRVLMPAVGSGLVKGSRQDGIGATCSSGEA